jgi:PAS domain S-box-containing protein
MINLQQYVENNNDFTMKINSFTLSFPGELEKEFRKDYFSSSLGFLRISFILGILYYSSFAFLDAYVLPEIKTQLFNIRFLLVCPVLLLVFILSYLKSFRKYWQLSAFMAVLIAGTGIIWMMIISPEHGRNTYYVGIILILIYSYMLIKLRFIWSTCAGWFIIILYALSLQFHPAYNISILTTNFFFLISANILGMFGGYALEYYTRRDFYFRNLLNIERHKVEAANFELEEEVQKKTFELQFDLHKRKEIEKSLRESESKFRLLAENSVDVTWQMDLKLNFNYISPSVKILTGFSQDEWIGSKLSKHSTRKEFFNMARKALVAIKNYKTFNYISFEAVILRKDGSEVPVEITEKLIFNERGLPSGLQGSTRDITERKHAEEKIKENLIEKETLLQELYHRTKNNMQIIASMLKMQARTIDDHHLQQSYQDIIDKIHSMSMVHQKLYQAKNLSQINLKEYIEDFILYLMQSYRITEDTVTLKMKLSDVFVTIDSAIPLGLVLTELISNVFKHAFPDQRKGKIIINLQRNADNEIQILFSDNGIGLPQETDLRKVDSMGMKNVFSLVEYQLRGKVNYIVDNGLQWQLRIQDDIYKKRI